MAFNVDDRVYYISGRHGNVEHNPLKNGKHSCKGTVSLVDYHNILVKWDNGKNNTYAPFDLEIACDLNSTDPNVSWKRKKE